MTREALITHFTFIETGIEKAIGERCKCRVHGLKHNVVSRNNQRRFRIIQNQRHCNFQRVLCPIQTAARISPPLSTSLDFAAVYRFVSIIPHNRNCS